MPTSATKVEKPKVSTASEQVSARPGHQVQATFADNRAQTVAQRQL